MGRTVNVLFCPHLPLIVCYSPYIYTERLLKTIVSLFSEKPTVTFSRPSRHTLQGFRKQRGLLCWTSLGEFLRTPQTLIYVELWEVLSFHIRLHKYMFV